MHAISGLKPNRPQRAGRLLAASLVAGLLATASAHASTITQSDTIGPQSNTFSNLTTGGPFTFLTDTASFNQFDASLGALVSATLSWTITGSENGSGNFAGTGIFSFGGQSQTVTYDTISDPGPKAFNFTGTASLVLGDVTGSGSYDSLFTGTIQQSGFFPWSGSMSVDASQITLVYEYEPAVVVPPTDAPEPATWALLFAGLAAMGFAARRQTQAGIPV
jgi:hypothetical protein